MRQLFFAVMLMMATITLPAQVVTGRLESTATNPAYNVPQHIRVNFETTNPAITSVTWEPVNEMWRATYRDNNRFTQIYYNNTGEAYRLALPVISTHVPDEVITLALDTYGTSMYDITKIRAAGDMDVYQVRLLEKAVPRTIWINETGVLVSDVYRVDLDDDEEVKIKVEEDKLKLKTEDEKLKIKHE